MGNRGGLNAGHRRRVGPSSGGIFRPVPVGCAVGSGIGLTADMILVKYVIASSFLRGHKRRSKLEVEN